MRSVKAMRPNMSVSTRAAAADWTLCPEVYSGNGGVTSRGVHAGSIRRRMPVTGRTRSYSNFVCQQATNASETAIATFA